MQSDEEWRQRRMEAEGGTPTQRREEREEDTIPVYGSLLAAISGYALAPIHRPSTTHSTHPTNLTPPASFHSLFHHLLAPSLSFFLFPLTPVSFTFSLVFYLHCFLPPLLLRSSLLLPPFMSRRLDIIVEHCMLLTPFSVGSFSVMADMKDAAWILISIRCVMDGSRAGRFVEMEIVFFAVMPYL